MNLKLKQWIDSDGYCHLSHVTDENTEGSDGLPHDPPDIHGLDWDEIKREIHNNLINRRLITWQDVQTSGDALPGVILSAIRKRLIELYKSEAK